MKRARLFRINHAQAVRLTKEVAFPEGVREVVVLREGSRRIIVAADSMWDDFFDGPGTDIGDRAQPALQNREVFPGE